MLMLTNESTMAVQICRICLEKSHQNLDIFSEEGHQRNIKDIVTQHFWFQIDEDDLESKQICMICLEKIENFHLFYTHIYEIHNNSSNQEQFVYVKTNNIKSESDVHQQEAIELNTLENFEVDIQESTSIKTEKVFIKSEESDSIDDYGSGDDDDDDDFVSPSHKKIKQKKKTDNSSDGDDSVKKCHKVIKSKKRKIRMPPKKSEEDFEAENEHLRKYFAMSCDLCDVKFSIFSDVTSHYRTAHGTVGYLICCGQKFYKRCRCIRHIQRHINPVKCELCRECFANKQLLAIHTDKEHSSENSVLQCDQCPRSFLKLNLLNSHRKQVHEQQDLLECKECDKRFINNVTLKHHMRSTHGNEEYVCEICAKIMKNKVNFDYHMKTQHIETSTPVPALQCSLCFKWLKTKKTYQRHMRDVHDSTNQKYICDDCGRECPSNGALRDHKRYHNLERTHKCGLCDKAFKKTIALREHMTTHTGEVLYTCPYCPRTLNSSSNLYKHKKAMHPIEWAESKNKK